MAKAQFVLAGSNQHTPCRVCIIGEPGAGKTRLAATFHAPFFLDLENGAGTARKGGVNRIIIPTDVQASTTVLAILNKLGALPAANGSIEHKPDLAPDPIQIGTIVVDSLDAIQQSIKMFRILKGKTKMERSDWDTLLNELQPLVLAGNSLPIDLIWIAHTKREEGENGRPGDMGFGVQGALKAQIPRWFDYILHIGTGPNGKRFVITQPTIAGGYRYIAKDRHNKLTSLAKAGQIELPAVDGYPSDEIAKLICSPD